MATDWLMQEVNLLYVLFMMGNDSGILYGEIFCCFTAYENKHGYHVHFCKWLTACLSVCSSAKYVTMLE